MNPTFSRLQSIFGLLSVLSFASLLSAQQMFEAGNYLQTSNYETTNQTSIYSKPIQPINYEATPANEFLVPLIPPIQFPGELPESEYPDLKVQTEQPQVNTPPESNGNADKVTESSSTSVVEKSKVASTETKSNPEIEEINGAEVYDPSIHGYFQAVPYDEWFHSDYWLGRAKWKNSLEFGMNGQTGNSESINFRVGGKVKREGKATNFSADITHARASSSGMQTQNNALFNSKLEWPSTDHPWYLFFKDGLEYDEFKDFDLRLSMSGGVGHRWINTDFTKLTLSFGSGFSKEFGAPNNRVVPEGVFGLEFEHQLTEKQSLELEVEHFPDWTGFGEFRNVADASYKIMLDDHLSLKLGVINRYDSTPFNRQRNDLDYALLLLWKN